MCFASPDKFLDFFQSCWPVIFFLIQFFVPFLIVIIRARTITRTIIVIYFHVFWISISTPLYLLILSNFFMVLFFMSWNTHIKNNKVSFFLCLTMMVGPFVFMVLLVLAGKPQRMVVLSPSTTGSG